MGTLSSSVGRSPARRLTGYVAVVKAEGYRAAALRATVVKHDAVLHVLSRKNRGFHDCIRRSSDRFFTLRIRSKIIDRFAVHIRLYATGCVNSLGDCCVVKAVGSRLAIGIVSPCSLLLEAQSAHLNHTVMTKEIRPIIQIETPKAPDPEDGPTSPNLVHQ